VKILHVAPYFHGAWAYGGIPRLSYQLAAAQAAQGHEVHAVTTDALNRSERRPAENYEISGVDVRVYRNLSNMLAYHLQLFVPRGIDKERERVADYDVVHIHGHRNLHNTWMAKMARQANVPTVLMPNGTLVNIERRQLAKSIYDRLWGREQVESTDAFVAVSHAEKRAFEALGLPMEKVKVIPNGVYLNLRTGNKGFAETHNIPGDYVLYLGKITPRKGIEHAIEALALLSDDSISLAIAGNDMGYQRNLERKATRQGVAHRVHFTGLVTGEMKVAAYREALFTVYTGRDEIFGLVPWESMLCGTPVIVADDSGCGEWVETAEAGHIVPYGDPEAIAQIINTRDYDRDQAMVQRGIIFCRERLDWSGIAREMVQYYREVIDGR